MNKRKNSKNLTPAYGLRPTDSEDGITLIIAIVLLAVITFISFALSTIIIREIRSAQSIVKTEPAISGAGAGGEIALYHFQRETGQVDSSDGSTPQSGASFDISSDFYDDPFIFEITDGEAITVNLYDVEQPANQDTGYTSVSFTNDAGSNTIRVTVASWGDLGTELCQRNIAPGSSYTCDALNQADDRYRITIDTTAVNGNATGEITAQPHGVPSNTPGFDVTGESGDVQRKLQITF